VIEPVVDEGAAKKDAKGVVTEIYQTISRGKTDSLFALLNDAVVVFGPRRSDATATRSDALEALNVVVESRARGKQRVQVRSSGVEVVVSQGGRSAWAFDVLSVEGRELAVIAVLSDTDDLWAVTAAGLAERPSSREIKAESARDAVVPTGATAVAQIGPGTSAAIEKLRLGLADQQRWGDDLIARELAIVAGPGSGQVARGKQAIQRLWALRMKANTRAAASGEPTAAITTDGQLVWISMPVTRVADGDAPLPLRLFAVYEKDGADWKLSALHEALAVDEPGSGAPWKKYLPPEPPRPPEPAAEPARATETDAKPTKARPAKANKAKAKKARPARKPRKP
jgi:ketosteroid isomerase-like protein